MTECQCHLKSTMHLKISSREVTAKLGACIFVLVAAHVAIQIARLVFGHDEVMGLIRYFDLDEEFNFPSLFSLFLFWLSGLLLAVIAHHAARGSGRFHLQWAGM